jgi:hypothetical protein
MGNQNHNRRVDDFSRTIREVDELRRESERLRSRVEDALRNRAFFPERRQHPRVGDREDRPRPHGRDDRSRNTRSA